MKKKISGWLDSRKNKEKTKKQDDTKDRSKAKKGKKYEEIGIDLGNNSIKISLVDKNHSDYVLDNRLYVVEDGVNLNEYFKTVDLSIKDFLKVHKIKRPSLNFTVPCDNENFITNVFIMSDVDDAILEDSIMYNVESIQPIVRKDYIHRYKKISGANGNSEIKVISSLLNRDFKEKIIELKEFNWRINKVVPQFTLGESINKREAVLIDFGYKTTRIYLYRNEKLVDLSTIDIGSMEFLRTTKEVLGLDYEEAEKVLKDGNVIRSFVADGNGQMAINTREHSTELADKLKVITEDMSDKLKRSIRVMELNNNTIMNNFLYTGGIANLDEFIELLSKDLDSTIKPLTIYDIKGLRNFGYEQDQDMEDQEGMDLEGDLDIGPGYKFQKDYEEPFIYSMLVPTERDTEFNYLDNIKFFIDKTALLIGVICASLFLNLGIFAINKQYDSKIAKASQDLEVIKDENSELETEISSLNENIDRNEIIIDRVENLKAKKKWLSDILYILPGETPTNVGVKNIEIEGRHAILRGYSETYSSVGYLAMALEEYGDVTITEVGEMGEEDLRVENNVRMKKEFIIDIQYEDRLIED